MQLIWQECLDIKFYECPSHT
jgi:hypothetical protein